MRYSPFALVPICSPARAAETARNAIPTIANRPSAVDLMMRLLLFHISMRLLVTEIYYWPSRNYAATLVRQYSKSVIQGYACPFASSEPRAVVMLPSELKVGIPPRGEVAEWSKAAVC